MGKVVVDISMSLDGYVTGPSPDVEHGLGRRGGSRLHDWALRSTTDADQALIDAAIEETGAVVMGRRTFEFVDGPQGWHEDVAYGGVSDGSDLPHNIVVTHAPPERVRLDGAFTFVTDGPEAALEKAQEIAGDRDVVVMGGGDLCGQLIASGLADEVRIHLAPVVLGAGTPLFGADVEWPVELEPLDVTGTEAATHLRYRVRPPLHPAEL